MGPRVSRVLRPIWPRLCLAATGAHSCRLAGSPASTVACPQSCSAGLLGFPARPRSHGSENRSRCHTQSSFAVCRRSSRPRRLQAWRDGLGTRLVLFFHLKVCKHSCRLIPWEAGHIINEAEALAALIWIQTLRNHLQGLDIFLFVDSKASEGILLKGYSSSAQLTVIASLFWKTVRQGKASAWIGRVPSSLNVADPISRGCFDIAQTLQAVQLTALLPGVSAWETLLQFLEGKHKAKRFLCADAPRLNRSDKRRRLHQGQA